MMEVKDPHSFSRRVYSKLTSLSAHRGMSWKGEMYLPSAFSVRMVAKG